MTTDNPKLICMYCDLYKGFAPCTPHVNNKTCDDSNNWEYYKRKVVMVYIPCDHCAYSGECSSKTCNQNSKWYKFEKREDYNEVSVHDRPAREQT